MSEPAAAAQLSALERLCRDNTGVRLLNTGSAESIKAAMEAREPAAACVFAMCFASTEFWGIGQRLQIQGIYDAS